MKDKAIVSNYGFIILCVGLSKLLGLVRDMLLAYYYGTSELSAAFAAASRIPLVFFDITLGTAVASAFIPVFNRSMQKEGTENAYDFANLFITTAGLIAFAMTILLVIFPDAAISVMAPGFSADTRQVADSLLRIMSPIVFIAVLCYTLVGIIQSLGKFTIPAIMSTISNVALILYYLLFNQRFGIYGLGTALVVGWVFQLLILLPTLKKFKFKYNPKLDFKDSRIRHTALLTLPVLISSWAQPINTLVATNLSSHIENGRGVTVVNYAYQLYFIMAGIFATGLTNLFFPKLSRCFAGGQKKEGAELLYDMLSSVLLIVFPVMLFFMICSSDLVSLVYERGRFLSSDTSMTAVTLAAYSAGMIGFSWQEILNKFFYSAHDSKTPMMAAALTISLNVLLSYILINRIGVAGIGLASALSVTVMALFLFVLAPKKTGFHMPKEIWTDIGKGTAAAVVSGALMMFVYTFMPVPGDTYTTFVRLFFVFACGAVSYLLMLAFFRVQKLRRLYRIFFKGGKAV